MATAKEIKERIDSIKKTRKTTSAMRMVSAAKLNRAQKNIHNMLPYSQALHSVLESLIAATDGDIESPLGIERNVKRVAIIAFSSDSSLIGAFNNNVIRELNNTVKRYASLGKRNIEVYTIGKKINEAANKQKYNVVKYYEGLASKPDYDECAELAEILITRFLKGELDRVEMIYHHFKSAGSQTLTRETYLPITLKKHDNPAKDKGAAIADFILEPSRETLLETIIPKSIKLQLYTALVDNNTSEHAARMVAMQIATDNADELISDLSVEYNKSRQQAITNQLLDIAGGQQA